MPDLKEIIPISCKETLEDIVSELKVYYQDNLADIMLAGSTGKGYFIDNWSDLDLYIITYQDDPFTNIKLLNILNKKNYPIHIGTTFYKLDNFLNLKVDTKTYITLYEKYYLKKVHPLLLENINLNDINKPSYNEIKKYAKKDIYNTFQVVLRETYKYMNNEENKKTLLKKLTILLKEYLNIRNIFTYHYKMVFDEFNAQMNIKFDIMDIILSKKNKEDFLEYIFLILNKINIEMEK